MFDLDTIFDPDQPARNHRLKILLPEPPPDVSPTDLSEEWHERWEERSGIMEYDAKMPLDRAEFLALADILRQMKLAGAPLPRVAI